MSDKWAMTAVEERDPLWLSLALIPVPAKAPDAVDLPTAYVPPSDVPVELDLELPPSPLFAWRSP